jgi:serine/threonine-protein kinase
MTDPFQPPEETCADGDRTLNRPDADGLEATIAMSQVSLRPHLPPTHDELVGGVLDQYEIRSLLGQGSMGRVYLARHRRLDRLCAVKVIDQGIARAEPKMLEMFHSEARSAARLNHANIVTVHSVGEERGYHFIEMEYVEGVSLRTLVRNHAQLPELLATRLTAQIAAALVCAHERDVLHCDVKPDNVMVSDKQVAKLADFGLARVHLAEESGTLPSMVGTPVFMAPELFFGQSVSKATDVYSLGATYFALLTGIVPHQGSKLRELASRHYQREAPSIAEHRPDVSPMIASFVEELMAFDPEHRPPSTYDLVDRLHHMANLLTDTREIVALAMEGVDVDWSADDDRFVFDVRLTGQRRQRVEGEVIDCEDTQERILTLWSPCARVTPQHCQYVLELNSRMPFGAISIRTYGGEPYFAAVQNLLRSTLDASEIRHSVVSIAEWADRIEHKLTGGDVH